MKLLFIAMLSVLAFANCQSSGNEESQEISAAEQGYDEIMDVHDEFMPITSKLPRIWEQLDTLKNSVDTEKVAAIKENITALQKVHKDMYDWMGEARAIKMALENADENDLSQLVQTEKLRIGQLKKETLEAYEKAQMLLKSLENQ